MLDTSLAGSKNDTCLKSGQMRHNNNHFALLSCNVFYEPLPDRGSNPAYLKNLPRFVELCSS